MYEADFNYRSSDTADVRTHFAEVINSSHARSFDSFSNILHAFAYRSYSIGSTSFTQSIQKVARRETFIRSTENIKRDEYKQRVWYTQTPSFEFQVDSPS